jgi:hypothetical protein
MPPLTTIYGDGTRVVGSTSQPLLPQPLHPNVMDYVTIMQSPTGGNYAMSSVEIYAVNNLVWGLVGTGIWDKIKAIYPVMGSTAASHKYNIKDPRDADAAYRLVFNGGGWTHSLAGMTPNGTTSWANTFFNPSTNLTLTSGHLSFYSPVELNSANGIDIGSATGGTNNQCCFLFCRLTNLADFLWAVDANAGAGVRARATSLSSLGFFLGNQNGNAGSDRTIWRNGVLRGSASVYGATTMPNANVSIGALNNGTSNTRGNFSARRCSFATIGDGLNNIEIKQFYTIVQAFQTALGRQV